MHELAICETICKTIEREAQKNKIKQVRVAKLRIGKMAAFERAHLDLCLKTFEKNLILAGTTFDIEEVPVELKCSSCHKKFIDARFDDNDFAHQIAHAPALYLPPPCPSCRHAHTKIITGDEMELVSIEGE